jgi:hypothetical protein
MQHTRLLPGAVVTGDKSFRGTEPNSQLAIHRARRYLPFRFWLNTSLLLLLLLILTGTALAAFGRKKNDGVDYGTGLVVNVPLPEPEVAQVVDDVAQNTVIRGTKEYNKDEFVTGAVAVKSTAMFPAWTEGGKVFYKVRKQVLDPQNFKDSADVGTLAVRYVVQPQGDNNTVLRIDAVFVEDFRRSIHPSNGSVESSEYKDIQDHLQVVELMKRETAEALREKQEHLAKENFGLGSDTEVLGTPPVTAKSQDNPTEDKTASQATPPPASPTSSTPQPAAYELQPGESLEQHVTELRRQVERLVKKPGAPLQSAPFHTATTLKSLQPGAEVLILISTPYWYGVETHDGQHGWIRRDQLEQVP